MKCSLIQPQSSALKSITIPFVGGGMKLAYDTYQYPFGYIFGTSSYEGGVETYQDYAENLATRFYIPSSLKSVIVTGGNISRGAFNNCSGLTNITISDSITSIDMYAFRGCSSLESITIPESVTSIDMYAFRGCTNLIQTENGVSYVDKWVIDVDSSLTQVQLRDNTVGIAERAFENCGSLTGITIPDSVTSIGESAFYGCSSLTSIVIPDSVTSIGEEAFRYCSSLESITIPDSVTSISGEAFRGCDSLESITIPDSVISIGDYAFSYCSSLTSINFQGSMAQWKAIDKGSFWNDDTGSYKVTCTDGTLDKNGDQVS